MKAIKCHLPAHGLDKAFPEWFCAYQKRNAKRDVKSMAGRFIIIGILLTLCACQSAEDRYWGDVQAIVDRTQPKKAN